MIVAKCKPDVHMAEPVSMLHTASACESQVYTANDVVTHAKWQQ